MAKFTLILSLENCEHAMTTALNGILWHGGLKVCTGTFLAFADYMKPALRLYCIK